MAFEQVAAVREIDPLQCDDWDGLMRRFPTHNVFHRQAWARTLHRTYGFHPCFLVIGQSDEPQSVLPLMEVRSWLTGSRAISLPFTDECQGLFQRDGDASKLFAAAVALGRTRGWRYVEIRGGGIPSAGATPSTTYYGHRLSLDTDLQSLRAGLKEATRRSLAKAERAGLTTKVARDPDAMRSYYRLHCKTRRRHGLPPQPWTFFEALQKFMFSGAGAVLLAYDAGTAVAGAVFLWGGDTAMFKFGASDKTYQHLRPSNLVMWRAIQFLHGQGAKTLDFGRTSLMNAGLRRFKLGWGATERVIEYFRFSLANDKFLRAADFSINPYARVFRIMPPLLAQICGQLIYKHVA